MAYEVGNQAISVPASADLSAKQFYFGSIDANGQVATTGAGLAADGVIADKPAAQGRPCALYTMPGMVVKVMCGAAVANGALLEADATARRSRRRLARSSRRRWRRAPETGASSRLC